MPQPQMGPSCPLLHSTWAGPDSASGPQDTRTSHDVQTPPMEARIVQNIIEYGRDDSVIVMGKNTLS